MTNAEMKEWIDSASYEDLLRRNRFSTSEDKIFHGEIGRYYISAMNKKKEMVGQENAVKASKKIGW